MEHSRASNEWTTRELARLRILGSLGAEAVARELGRSVASVRAAAYRHRISLRRPRSRRGLVLGQARDIDIPPAMRAVLLAARTDATGGQRCPCCGAPVAPDLCPCCGRRPIRVKSSGFCLVCHREHLAERHEEAAANLVAERREWAARQAKKAAADRLARDKARAGATPDSAGDRPL